MSDPNEVLKPILLRSSTPGASEKVLHYLEGMNRDSANITPPHSIHQGKSPKSPRSHKSNVWDSGSKLYAPTPKGSMHSAQQLEKLAASEASYGGNGIAQNTGHVEDDEDIKSDEQEGQRSEPGTVLPMREPGPQDPPGPHYESFGSGPSFGNFGPLPVDNASNTIFNTWQPAWIQHNKAPPEHQPWGGLSPGLPAKVPLPASPQPASVNIGVESPSSPRSKMSKQNSQAPPRASNKEPSLTAAEDDRAQSAPRGPSRAASRTPKASSTDRPLSPAQSRATAKTRATERGTTYPPLPESVMGESHFDSSPPKSKAPLSPRALSKSPSVSPSDSPSQMYKQRSPPTNQNPVKYQSDGESSPHNGVKQMPSSGARSPGSAMSGGNMHQTRPFSPYRHGPTTEDLLHAAIRGRAMMSPTSNGKQFSTNGKLPSAFSPSKQPSLSTIQQSASRQPEGSIQSQSPRDRDITPTPSRPHSPDQLDQEEEQIVHDTLARTPRTSYYAASALEPDVANSHFHDMELCILLHQENNPNAHDVVKRALRKAVRQRVKKLGMKYDSESIKQYRKSYHDHDPSVHLQPGYTPSTEEPPEWAKDIIQGMNRMQQHIDGLGPKIEGLRISRSYAGEGSRYITNDYRPSEGEGYGHSPMTQTVNIHTQPTGTLAESMFQPPETEVVVESNPDGSHHSNQEEEELDDGEDEESQGSPDRGVFPNRGPYTDGETRTHGPMSDLTADNRDDSPGQQFLEEELYKLRQKPQGSQSQFSHRTWEVARDDDQDFEEGQRPTASGLPTIPDSNGGAYTDRRPPSPPLPPIPQEGRRDLVATPQQMWHAGDYSTEAQPLPPWQRIHQRLLSWAIIWPMSELDAALNSTTRGHQVDEVALSIWSTQTYKRYVRTRMTDSPQGVVDRLFVPPNMADAISNAVFNGRHGDACGMLRDLWSPFGLEGMPRLLVVLAKHRSDANHWVVHRFSLPDGALTTYDSYPERTLPDGRPLGWWFAIRVAWPNAIYPSPDHLMQKMVRLHRPMQLGIDNSVAAGGIWRNILMGSRAERSLDLERLRDLINTEVKNLRQRKQMGKLSIGAPRPTWEDMN